MKKKLSWLVMLGMLISAIHWPAASAEEAAGAAGGEDKPRILDIIGHDTYLMDDGSIWSLVDGDRILHTKGQAASITGTEYEGLGVAKDGSLIQWDVGKAPHVVSGQTGVKMASGTYWLKTDGSVWTEAGQVKGLSGIVLIGAGDQSFAALSGKGEVLYADPYDIGTFKTLGTAPDASSVTAMAVRGDRVALLYASGDVVVYEGSNFDDNGKIVPVTVAHDAVHIVYTSGDPTDALIVTRKDGTVWTTGSYQDRWKLANQAAGLSGIVRTAELDNTNRFYAERGDGSWVLYDGGAVTPVEVPSVEKLTVSVSNAKPFVGDGLTFDIQETYTNGANIKVPAAEADIQVEKPYLLQKKPDGSFKALGVGQTKVTVTSGGISQTATVSVSLRSNLKFSKQVGGVVFVPAKAVLQALGGTVTVAGGETRAAFGDTTLSFAAGSKNATLNGNPLPLTAAPLADKTGLMIPASALTDALGAKAVWNAQWKQAEISFGDAKLTVVSADTAGLVKKAAQGSLAKFIGKTYWVNYFQDWERFSKVTVTDVLPDDAGTFTFVFKSASGKTLKSYPMSSSFASQLFAYGTNFLTYDPYKKYPSWSSAIWKQIKAGQVSLGMTKDQVQLSWGSPSGKSVVTSAGRTIETWVYANFDTVSFVNGKASLIIE